MSKGSKLRRSFRLYLLAVLFAHDPAQVFVRKIEIIYLEFSNFSTPKNMTDSMKEESVAALLKGIDR